MYLGDSFDQDNMEEYMREVSSRSDGLVSDASFSSALLHRFTGRCGRNSRPR